MRISFSSKTPTPLAFKLPNFHNTPESNIGNCMKQINQPLNSHLYNVHQNADFAPQNAGTLNSIKSNISKPKIQFP